jgi:hypothetical protein
MVGRTLALFWLLYSVFRISYEVAILRSQGAPVPYAKLAIPTLLLSATSAAVCWFLFRAYAFASRRLTFLAAIVVAWMLRLVCYALIQRLPLLRTIRTAWFGVAVFTIVLAATVTAMSWWQRQLQAARLHAESEEKLVRAELRVLAEQLEPHFLLNTLSGISALAATDASAAREMLTGLQDLLAYSIRHGAAATVSLGDEVHFIRQYLRLQSLRFGARLHSTIAVPHDLLPRPVPRLILQPLVENALKYGVACREEGGEIEIDAESGSGALTIHVRNSSAAEPDSPGIGIGIAAVRARLALLFGNRHRVTLSEDVPGMTVVTVTMPMIGKKGAAA